MNIDFLVFAYSYAKHTCILTNSAVPGVTWNVKGRP